MRIAIDISSVIYGTGVSVYTKNLVENLLKIDKENDYIFFGGSLRRSGEIRDYLDKLTGNRFEPKIFSIPPTFADLIWNKMHLFKIENLTGKIDVFHSSDWTQPPSDAFKVTTIHDLSPVLFQEMIHPRIVSAHKRRLEWVIKEADRVIVPSETTAKDCLNLGIAKEKLRVIAEAVDPIFSEATGGFIDKIKNKYDIGGKYLLSVGVNPRKNTERIIAAYELIKREHNLKLVIIGHPHDEKKDVDGVIYTGHIPQNEEPALFTGSEALIYPSIYEGFGLPILEAFTCKVPVVTSNSGSMAEVAGDGAVLVDPLSVNSVKDGIIKAIREREKLVKKGKSELKRFSWQKAARETLEVYKESGK